MTEDRARRVEFTLSQEAWNRLEEARGHEPRASFVKRALESALGSTPSRPPEAQGEGVVPTPRPVVPGRLMEERGVMASVSSRAPVEKNEPTAETPLPKIAPRRR